MSIVKLGLQRGYHMIKSRSFEKISDTPYATHIPILIGITHYFDIYSVLEFGSGMNSTVPMMNIDNFPTIKKITSYENDIDWYNKIKGLTADDSRVNLKYCDSDVSLCAQKEDVQQYDMVFIDDSMSLRERAATITSVMSKKPKLVVVHDFENSAYRKALRGEGEVFCFKELLPNVGVYSTSMDVEVMKKIKSTIKKHKKTVKPDEINAWREIFSSERAS